MLERTDAAVESCSDGEHLPCQTHDSPDAPEAAIERLPGKRSLNQLRSGSVNAQ